MKILVVVDMQNDFITGALGTKEAEGIVPCVVEKIRSFEGEVLYTMDTHSEDYLKTEEGKHLPVKHCIRETNGWKLQPDILNCCQEKGAKAFEKNTFGCLTLATYVKEQKEIEQIELVGLCTDICVISNAMILKAAVPEVPIVVDAACCAGVTKESHTNALHAMSMCQIKIKNNA